MASSIHIAKINSGSFLHNDRSVKPSYLIDDSNLNEVSVSSDEALNNFHKLKYEAQQNYTMRTNQKMQKSVIFLKEAIVNLEEHHTLKDLEPIKNKLENYGFKVLQMSIHRDEGFVNKDDNKKRKNYHAHITMLNVDVKTGKTVKFGKSYRSELSKLQTFVAKTLGMERGKVSVKEEAERINAPMQKASRRLDTHEYKQAMKIREKETQKLKLTVKQLKAELEAERKRMASAKIYTKEDYQALNSLKKETNRDNLQDIYLLFLRMKQEHLANEKEQQQQNESLESKNETLQRQNRTLQTENETLQLRDKRIQSENETIQQQNESLQRQNRTLQTKNDEIQKENSILKNTIDKLKNTIAELKSKLLESHQDMSKLIQAYESMQNEQQRQPEPEPEQTEPQPKKRIVFEKEEPRQKQRKFGLFKR